MRILAVDDEQAALFLLEEAIRKAVPQAQIHAFTLPTEALAYAQENQVDVAFLDQEMPGMDGMTLGRKLTELYPVTNGGAESGYVMKVSASGSQGTIVMMVGVDANKAITGISVVSHAETSGIGTKVVDNEPNSAGVPVLDQFVGLSGAGTLNVGSTITAISGATVSTKGITMGANAALAVADLLG